MKIISRRQLLFGLLVTALIVMVAVLPSKAKKREYSYDPAFNAEIQLFTSHEIPRTSPILIRLAANAVKSEEVGKKLLRSPFTFYPDIEGEAVWTDQRTIEFHPKKPLPSNTYYEATFALGEYFTDLPPARRVFQFQFSSMRQTFEVIADGTQCIDNKSLAWQSLTGSLNTADFEFPEKVEALLKATQNGKPLKMTWTHTGAGSSHRFTVDSISRGTRAGEVLLEWDGSPIGLDIKDSRSVIIPAQGDFYSLHAEVNNGESQFVTLRFSDPLLASQDLRGLITIGEAPLQFTIEGSIVKVFPTARLYGEQMLKVETGIKNVVGLPLLKRNSWEVNFEQIKPALRLYGSGTILPGSGTLPFVFEAVSVKAVDVEVMKIYENNVLQFLQVNELDGRDELWRVGKVITKKTLSLEGKPGQDLRQWNRHVIDLSTLVAAEPGAIYRISLSIKREHSIYKCTASGSEATGIIDLGPIEVPATDKDEAQAYFSDDEYSDYYENRSNPCHPAYYSGYYDYYDEEEGTGSTHVGRNVLASDLGLIAKKGAAGKMYFAVTDLRTAAPIPGVTLEVYDFAQQVLRRVVTGADGLASTQVNEEPFVLVAKYGAQRGYLKLDEGYALSLSKFEVGGAEFHEGVKGFLFGERGVWRPGDSLYLTFILEDELRALPKDHPVTLRIFNPTGKEIRSITRREHTHGVYTFATATSAEAPTGNYLAQVSVGGSQFSKTLKIETVMPNRLKINLKFNKEYLGQAGSEINETELNSNWLHGAPGRQLKAVVSAKLKSVNTNFPAYAAYTFDDPIRRFATDDQVVWEGQLNDSGFVKFPMDLEPATPTPGKVMASFTVKVFEPGGAFSVDYFSMPFFPFRKFVGVRAPESGRYRGGLFTGKAYPVDVVVVNEEGKPTGNDSVTVSLFKVKWDWWWDQTQDNVSAYNGNFSNEQVDRRKIAISNGVGKYTLQVDSPNWGRYLMRVEEPGGHITGRLLYIDFPYEMHFEEEQSKGAAYLSFSSDKPKYNVGETVSLTIPTGPTGRALVSIESGSRVVHTGWVVAQGKTSVYKFKATADMAPNVFAHVTLLQPHSQTANDLPIRLYGVIPLEVYDAQSKLTPVISTPANFRPEEKATITVKEAHGRPMVYTLAVVDEGLLDLTRFKTPDPWTAFNAKEGLNVKTWDLYDKVIGAYNGDLSRLLSVGGDGGNDSKGGAKVNRFKPMVKFMGPFVLSAGQVRSHTFDMPNYVGSVKTMVVARWESAYGAAEKQTLVNKPLMVLGTLPRVVGPGEEINLPVTVFAMQDQIKDVTVKVQSNDYLQLSGVAEQKLSFKTKGDQVAYFKLKVKQKPGTATVKITATGGGETSVYHVDVDVRLSNPPVTVAERVALAAHQSWSKNLEMPGLPGTNKASLEVSVLPPLNLNKRMDYLISYPHGCLEQTTSSAFPQIYLSSLMEMSEKQRKEVENNVRAGMGRLVGGFQNSSGGFGYWPGDVEVNDWGTNYAGAFLLEARKKGYSLSQQAVVKWISHQTSRARLWSNTDVRNYPYWRQSNQLIQADRLYLLALAGAPEMGAMNRLRETPSLYTVAKWRLAAAYQLAGQPEVATMLTRGLATEVPYYRELSCSYGSDLRDMALILESMAVMNLRERGQELALRVSDRLSTDSWCSTQETAYALVALAKFYNVTGNGAQALNFTYRLNGGEWITVQNSKALALIDLDPRTSTQVMVELNNNQDRQLFVRTVCKGVPLEGKEKPMSKYIGITMKFTDVEGNEIDPAKLTQGMDFKAVVTVLNTSRREAIEEMALTTIFPSGWEVHNQRMAGQSTQGEYQDIRDDRIYTYFDLTRWTGGSCFNVPSVTFTFDLNASYLGRFYLPSWKALAMYDEEITATTAGRWVEIVPAE